MAELFLRHGLIANVPQWFGNAGQKGLNQRVHEGKEGLLRYFDAFDLTTEAMVTEMLRQSDARDACKARP